MSTKEIDALIIRNLRDLDAAANYTRYKLETKIGGEINKIGNDWIEEHEWNGDCNWDHPGLWVAPANWKAAGAEEGDDKWLAKFWLHFGIGDDGHDGSGKDHFWLTRLCGDGTGMIALRWYQENICSKKGKWKQFVQPWKDRICKTGFAYEDGEGLFSIPVRVDAEQLASAIEQDNMSDALEPFVKALDKLLAAKPTFDKMLEEAKREFALS